MSEPRIEALRQAVQSGLAGGEFPQSLLAQFESRGYLSGKQWYWVEKLAKPREAVQLPSFAGVIALLARAGAHLKYPKINLQFANGERLRLHVAGERSRHAGSVQLTDGSGFGGRYYGRINADGAAILSDRFPESKAELVNLLGALAERPAEVAAQYGHITGSCCFCHKELSDERSLAVGYGPICAGHYGLPWGEKEVAVA